jgi:ribose 5-phosphate isomerase A
MLAPMSEPSDPTALKRVAASHALESVKDGMKLGLGTGTTAEAFIDILALRVRAGFKVIGVPTSERTAKKARALGITLGSLDELAPLDLTIDGADEADRNLDLIKGAGGALLREKIVAASSKQLIIIADESKLVARLGHQYPLPVEVAEFGHKTTQARLRIAFAELGYQGFDVKLRMKDDVPFRSDSNNVIYDCTLGGITNAARLAGKLSTIPGVADHGLFIGLATTLLIAHPGEVERIERT